MIGVNQPTAQLVAEHEKILRHLQVLTKLAELAEGDDPPVDAMGQAVGLVRDYADALHHGKEEDLLFPLLEQRGMPRDGGPIGCMLKEHVMGRECVAQMAGGVDDLRAGNASGGADFADAALRYVALLQDHIAKENQVLFPMAEQMLGDEDKRELATSFEGVERDTIGAEKLAEMIAALDALAAKFA